MDVASSMQAAQTEVDKINSPRSSVVSRLISWVAGEYTVDCGGDSTDAGFNNLLWSDCFGCVCV